MPPPPARPARGSTGRGHAFSRSYGIILPSSFTRVLPSALVSSTSPPVSVSGTASRNLGLRGFSWKHGVGRFARKGSRSRLGVEMGPRICQGAPPTRLDRHFQPPDGLAFSVTPSQLRQVREC